MRSVVAVFLGGLLVVPAVRAQSSASFRLTEFTMNAGGDPRDGSSAASASFHIKLDAIGDGVAGPAGASASFRSDAGFVAGYPPPGEVQALRFTDKQTFLWSPERSVGVYEVYRDLLSSVAGAGSCFAAGATGEAAADTGTPVSGQGWFYLVTARNRLGEEGTKGTTSGGADRPNPAPCP